MYIVNIRYVISTLLDIVYFNNDKCVCCEEDIYDNYLCKACTKKIMVVNSCNIIQINDHNIKCYSSLFYDGLVREFIKDLKYKSHYNKGRVLSKYMIETINNEKINYDIVTYVPMYKGDEKARGFNQSKFIAELIDKNKCKKTLLKNRRTKSQKSLSRDERWDNLKACFSICRNINVINKSILLIDDVFTSGATAYTCSEILLRNGAREVNVLTAASGRVKNARL